MKSMVLWEGQVVVSRGLVEEAANQLTEVLQMLEENGGDRDRAWEADLVKLRDELRRAAAGDA
jgi:hypothetical protein